MIRDKIYGLKIKATENTDTQKERGHAMKAQGSECLHFWRAVTVVNVNRYAKGSNVCFGELRNMIFRLLTMLDAIDQSIYEANGRHRRCH